MDMKKAFLGFLLSLLLIFPTSAYSVSPQDTMKEHIKNFDFSKNAEIIVVNFDKPILERSRGHVLQRNMAKVLHYTIMYMDILCREADLETYVA
jgi:hypothetical protein